MLTGSGQEARLGGVSGNRVPEARACRVHCEPRAGGGRAPGCGAQLEERDRRMVLQAPGVLLWVVGTMPVKCVANRGTLSWTSWDAGCCHSRGKCSGKSGETLVPINRLRTTARYPGQGQESHWFPLNELWPD